jgi:poly-gamma-glutamate synthesis protein (capsule biosynthesis protein)
MRILMRAGLVSLSLIVALAGACAPSQDGVTVPTPGLTAIPERQAPTLTPLQPLPTETATPEIQDPSSTRASPAQDQLTGLTIWLSPDLPEPLRDTLALPGAFRATAQRAGASLQVVVGDGRPISRWVYALVAPFPTVEDRISLAALTDRWGAEGRGPFGGAPILMDGATLAVFSAWWGPPGDGAVQVIPAGDLAAQAWENRPSWAIVPFERLDPRWKVLEVAGTSPVRADFTPEDYPLGVPVSLRGDRALVDSVITLYGPQTGAPLLAPTNRDPERLTVLVMTGVTALVRSTAWTMERQGMTYPAQDIGPWLREADITHISNEVPFAYDCPYPDPVQKDLIFCSDPRYIELLEDVGTDVVELTGDHFQDWGPQAMMDTLALYRERGWPYYGGGENVERARSPVILEHNGNRLAFIGCNGKGGYYAGAGVDRPGAVGCDFEYLVQEIGRIRQEGALPVATFQHFEYYTFAAPPNQVADFRRLAEAGAAIVSGSQAHHPQVLEFHSGAFIHYGLGNLFFDQIYVSPETARAFIDRHVIYDGRHISTELLTIQFEDYARSRPMTQPERRQFLQTLFTASGW